MREAIAPYDGAAHSHGAAEDATRQMTKSPCVKVCELNAENICKGCGRAIDEIAGWNAMSDMERAGVVERATARLETLEKDVGAKNVQAKNVRDKKRPG